MHKTPLFKQLNCVFPSPCSDFLSCSLLSLHAFAYTAITQSGDRGEQFPKTPQEHGKTKTKTTASPKNPGCFNDSKKGDIFVTPLSSEECLLKDLHSNSSHHWFQRGTLYFIVKRIFKTEVLLLKQEGEESHKKWQATKKDSLRVISLLLRILLSVKSHFFSGLEDKKLLLCLKPVLICSAVIPAEQLKRCWLTWFLC